MSISRWVSRALALVALGTLFALSACSPNTLSSQASNPTSTPASVPTNIPTPVPDLCNPHFSTEFYSTLPGVDFKATSTYTHIPLPSQTRFMESDVHGGQLGKVMCTLDTTQSVSDFMADHLAPLGWRRVSPDTRGCIGIDASLYKDVQCWNGDKIYTFTLGINSNLDWIILLHDPDFGS